MRARPLRTTLFLALPVCWLLSGCAALPIPQALQTASDVLSGVSLASSLATGKGASEHALDAVTGKDCRFDALARDDRALCETPGSYATQGDFRGLSALFPSPRDETNGGLATNYDDIRAWAADGVVPSADPAPEKTYSFLPKY